MKSIIICEGGTDLTLIQYYLEKTANWMYSKADSRDKSYTMKKIMKRNENTLEIGAAGSCNKIPRCFEKILNYNLVATTEERYQNVIIISDRDEADTVGNFEAMLSTTLFNCNYTYEDAIGNDKWIKCKATDCKGKSMELQVLFLIIPFEETGALETFLLDAVSKEDQYEAKIIQNVKSFVRGVDPEKRYLNKRRYVTKADFDVYFCIRTPLSQFAERRDILKNVPWEQYKSVQSCFAKLNEI